MSRIVSASEVRARGSVEGEGPPEPFALEAQGTPEIEAAGTGRLELARLPNPPSGGRDSDDGESDKPRLSESRGPKGRSRTRAVTGDGAA